MIDRRDFMKYAAITGVASTAGCTQTPDQNKATAPAGSGSGPGAFELDETTIGALQEGMNSGKYTSRSITELYLKRIDEIDRNGPTLRSVIETNPDALSIADALDQERKAKGVRGLLHGIPILVKDNLDTGDKMTTTAGSLALEGSIPGQDSFVVQRLREAGAVILGKANLSEWANFRSTRSTSGWSARGGQCRNPYVLDRNPCGSSSGSGAATAANLCAVSIGTETNGSIVCPSTSNGLVGFKPTVGLVSRAGIIPISHTQDTAGPMTRTVRDAAIVLSAIAGGDPRDAATAASQGNLHTDYTQFLAADGLKGARIGVARKFFGFSPSVDALMEEAIAEMKRQGAEVIDPADIPNTDDVNDSQFEVLLYEFKADLNAYLASLGASARVKTLKDIIDFNEKNKDREMPHFGQEIFLQAESKGPLTSEPYLAALRKDNRLMREEGIDAVVIKNRLDAIIAPTGGPSWTIDHINGDHFVGGSSTPAAVAGYPNITVPCGYVRGLPIGISFFGRAWSEPALLRVAYAYEQATKHRQPPKYLASLL